MDLLSPKADLPTVADALVPITQANAAEGSQETVVTAS